jgi:hypothetical protein
MIHTKWLFFLTVLLGQSIFTGSAYQDEVVETKTEVVVIKKQKVNKVKLLLARQKQEKMRKIKLLLLKYRQTGDRKYLKAAIALLLQIGRLNTIPVML